jgi:hypothetical protein
MIPTTSPASGQVKTESNGDNLMLKLLIGLGIPYAGVIGLLPWVASVDRYVLGVTFIYAWIFLWFVLTSVCMWSCWYLFDRASERDEFMLGGQS